MNKNKKTILAMVLSLALVSAAGVSYAWFTATAGEEAVTAKLGRIEMEVTYEDGTNSGIYEPGVGLNKKGQMENVGNLSFMAKMDMAAVVEIFSDDNGALLNSSYTITNDPNVTVNPNMDFIGYKDFEDGSWIGWMYDRNNPDDYYVLVDGPVAVDFGFEVDFNGPGMGNKYMDAEISFASGWVATQLLDDAVMDELGVNPNDLVLVNNDLGLTRFSAYAANSASSYESAVARAQALLGR